MNSVIGHLERVSLKNIWEHESRDFTPWLSEAKNLADLGDLLFKERLEHRKLEVPVGPFRADMLCKKPSTQNWVVIENQYNKTDHDHLGKLLTYAAGLNGLDGQKVEAVVWIAEEFLPEHRAVLDRLNEISGDQMQFFGLEIEMWKIGNSLPAPKFNVVCKPNLFSNKLKRLENMTATEMWQYKYWEDFKQYLKNQSSPKNEQIPVPVTSGIPTHCLTISIEKSKFQFNVTVHTGEKRIGVEIVIPDSKESFEMLENQKEAIEREFCEQGEQLEWQNNPNSKVSRIAVYKYGVDIWDKDDRPNQFGWLTSKLIKFRKVFLPRINELTTTEKNFEETT